MPHSAPLISTLVFGLVLAFCCGLVAQRLRLPPLIGYLLAGIIPHAKTGPPTTARSIVLEERFSTCTMGS